MILDKSFWNSIVSVWISVQSSEAKINTSTFAKRLAEKQRNTKTEKVKDLFEELLED